MDTNITNHSKSQRERTNLHWVQTSINLGTIISSFSKTAAGTSLLTANEMLYSLEAATELEGRRYTFFLHNLSNVSTRGMNIFIYCFRLVNKEEDELLTKTFLLFLNEQSCDILLLTCREFTIWQLFRYCIELRRCLLN